MLPLLVCSLEEGGQTALGPALLLSVAMAAQCPGSRVVICTDGLANVGLGNLDDIQSDDIYAESFAFYNTVTEMATQGGYVKRDFIYSSFATNILAQSFQHVLCCYFMCQLTFRVCVSVLTIDSSNSGLIELGKVAVATGGQVNPELTLPRHQITTMHSWKTPGARYDVANYIHDIVHFSGEQSGPI